MNIGDCMKTDMVRIFVGATIADAAKLFVQRHVSVLPVVNTEGNLVGILRLSDMLSLEMPDFVKLLEDVDFVRDFGAVETTRPAHELLTRSVATLMRPATIVHRDCGLLRAYAIMVQNELHDIPVVDSIGVLVGIASRTDIGTLILSNWTTSEEATS
jgi:MFS transporter, DHA2 family, multidrug resistance protein